MYQSKKRDVENVKQQLNELRKRKCVDENVDLQAKKVKNESIRMMQEQSNKHYKDFLASKKDKFKDEFKTKIEEEK